MDERERLLGQNIANLRGSISQQAVADAMRERGWKWSQSTVWSLETGGRSLRLLEARDLAAILNVSMDALTLPSAENEARGLVSQARKLLMTANGCLRELRNVVGPAVATLDGREGELTAATRTDIEAVREALDILSRNGDHLTQAFTRAAAPLLDEIQEGLDRAAAMGRRPADGQR